MIARKGFSFGDHLTEEQKRKLMMYGAFKLREEKRKQTLQTGELLKANYPTIKVKEKKTPEVGKTKFYLHELLSLEITEIPFLVEGMIPKNAISFLTGPSDVGKSTWCTQLCLGITAGKEEFLGHKINYEHKRSIIVNTEDNSQNVAVKIKKQLQYQELSMDKQKRMMLWTDGHNLVEEIEQHLSENLIDLIVVDAFSDVFKGDINSANSVRDFLEDFLD